MEPRNWPASYHVSHHRTASPTPTVAHSRTACDRGRSRMRPGLRTLPERARAAPARVSSVGESGRKSLFGSGHDAGASVHPRSSRASRFSAAAMPRPLPPRYISAQRNSPSTVIARLTKPIRYAGALDAALPVLTKSVKQQGLAGLVHACAASASSLGQDHLFEERQPLVQRLTSVDTAEHHQSNT